MRRAIDFNKCISDNTIKKQIKKKRKIEVVTTTTAPQISISVPTTPFPETSDKENGENIADISFPNLSPVSIYETTRVEKARRQFCCLVEGCRKSYLYKQHLERHKISHEKLRLACGLCPVVVSSQINLSNHMKTHDLGKHYHCSVCNLVFRRRSVFLNHKKILQCRGEINLVILTETNRDKYTIVQRGSTKQLKRLLKTTKIAEPQLTGMYFLILFF
ncbi:MAG: C2H2-type zinc finger protein [Janthinobacterium lividum]